MYDVDVVNSQPPLAMNSIHDGDCVMLKKTAVERGEGKPIETRFCGDKQVRGSLQTRTGKALSVTFDETRNEAYPSLHENKESSAQYWYSTDEYREFKRKNQKAANEIIKGRRKNGMIWRQALERTYKVLVQETLEAMEEQEDDEFAFDEFDFEMSLLTPAEQRHLRSVFAGSAASLGLEHQIVELIGNDRHDRRLEQTEAIYQAEESIDFRCDEFKAQFIRYACEGVSLAPRLYSREVALALEAEVCGAHRISCADDSSASSESSYPKGF